MLALLTMTWAGASFYAADNTNFSRCDLFNEAEKIKNAFCYRYMPSAATVDFQWKKRFPNNYALREYAKELENFPAEYTKYRSAIDPLVDGMLGANSTVGDEDDTAVLRKTAKKIAYEVVYKKPGLAVAAQHTLQKFKEKEQEIADRQRPYFWKMAALSGINIMAGMGFWYMATYGEKSFFARRDIAAYFIGAMATVGLAGYVGWSEFKESHTILRDKVIPTFQKKALNETFADYIILD